MRHARGTVDGFDYRKGKPMARTRPEWRDELLAVIKAGGFRRVENGETFAHDKNGTLLFEAYANIHMKSQGDEA